MAVNATHPDYDASLPVLSRARDVLAGEDAVKRAGEKYLPRLDSQSDEEYAAYKARASFFGATARTLEEYLDLVFRRAPVISLPEGKVWYTFAADCDLAWLDVRGYARRVVAEVLSVGRCGSLVLWDETGVRPWLSMWGAEDIVNTARAVLTTTPQGQAADAQFVKWLMEHQKEAGVFSTVSGLVDQFSDNPAAKMTAQEIAERVRRAQGQATLAAS